MHTKIFFPASTKQIFVVYPALDVDTPCGNSIFSGEHFLISPDSYFIF